MALNRKYQEVDAKEELRMKKIRTAMISRAMCWKKMEAMDGQSMVICVKLTGIRYHHDKTQTKK